MGNLLMLPYKRQLERGYSNFERFYDEYMHMGRRYNSDEELFANPPEYDVYVTGSDQVWNPRYIREKFYLGFVEHGRKISYAASLGVSKIPDENKNLMSEYLNGMDGISVREIPAIRMLEELTDKKIKVNCDPVFLIDKLRWQSIEKMPDKPTEDYILCYMIYKPKWFNEWLRSVKRKTGKKIVFVGLTGYRPVINDGFVRSAGPREFLWLIDHSSGVVTSSFHGTAFSILFGKPFVTIPDPPRPDRIKNLLQLFGLEDRGMLECDLGKGLEAYPYDSISQKVTILREQSNLYLKSQFKDV
jgi:hypothetical protein